jgi:ribosomal protein L28
MSRLCQTCGRGSNRANNRSHSNVATKRQQFANLQTKTVGGLRVKLCTRCIKTMSTKLAAKQAAAAKKPVAKKAPVKAAPKKAAAKKAAKK